MSLEQIITSLLIGAIAGAKSLKTGTLEKAAII